MELQQTVTIMSKRAEERALEAYPVKQSYNDYYGDYEDVNIVERISFQEGYKQAEKDLSLTIEDLELLHTFLYAAKNNKQGAFTFTRLSDEQYKEVLRRFKAIKEKQK